MAASPKPGNLQSVPPSSDLPAGWTVARLDQIVTLVNGFAFSQRHWKRSGLPIVRIQNLNNPDAPFNYCDDSLPEQFRIRPGELLFAWSGTPGTSFGAHIWRGGDAWLNQHIFKVEFDRDLVNVDYLRAAINYNLGTYIAEAQGGSGLAHISKTALNRSVIRLAPLNEQKRIMVAVGDFLREIDAGEEALRRTREHLKHYVVSVLRAAVDGTLTAAWRASNPSVEATVAAIDRKPRSAEASTQLDLSFPAATQDSRPGTPYLDSPHLPPLPSSWVWTTVDQVGEARLGRQRSPKHRSAALLLPYLRVANVFEDRIDVSDVLRMSFTPEEAEIYRLEDGDVLLNEGQSLELVGRAAIYRGEIPGACFQNALIRFRAGSSVLPEYALIVFRHYLHSKRFQRAAKWTTNIAHLSVGRFAVIEFPLPPLAEQRRIVDKVQTRISHVTASERSVDDGLIRSYHLRRKTLESAFEGRLVPQDPTDEPAQELVERIRQSMAQRQAKKKASPSRRKLSGATVMNSRAKRSILDTLKAHPQGITPEDLLRAAGYDLDNIDEFYAELRLIASSVEERRPPTNRSHLWPKDAEITLRLKEE
jgi:type I restriction enzyme S subunit